MTAWLIEHRWALAWAALVPAYAWIYLALRTEKKLKDKIAELEKRQ